MATECATNLARHGGGGQLHLHLIGHELEMIAIDSGRGMDDVERCLTDGYSTAGSAGTGMGAIRRLSSVFDIHSVPGRGTAVLSRIRNRKTVVAASAFESGGVWRAAPHEEVCGDGLVVGVSDDSAWVFVADGLGHGLAAGEAAVVAGNAFRADRDRSAVGRLQAVHGALRATRGAAVAAARIQLDDGSVEFSGIGNIAAFLRTSERSTGLVSMAGIAGHQVRKFQPFQYRWTPESLLIMHSDGLQSQWSFDSEPGLTARHPSLIAAVLARNFTRGRDDVGVVVLKQATR